MDAGRHFYAALFGWTFTDAIPADAIGWLVPVANDHDHWHVTFTVASRDESTATAEKLGAVVITSDDTEWTRAALIRDPQGAELTLSQFTPPGG